MRSCCPPGAGIALAVALIAAAAGAAQAGEPGGQLAGTVTRAEGVAAGGGEGESGIIVVSASGPAGAAVATCDADGRFEFADLPAGVYLLRAHLAGTAASGRAVVAVRSGLSTFHTLKLERAGAFAGQRTVLAAGLAEGLGENLLAGLDDAAAAPPPPGETEAAAADDAEPPHSHAEKLWRLRRARRSVLKEQAALLQPGAGEDDRWHAAARPRWTPAGAPASDSLGGFPLSGQVYLLTRMHLNAAGAPWSINRLPGQVTYLDIGPAAGGADGADGWAVQGAVTAGGGGSWVLAGTYATSPAPNHDLAVEASYSRQRSPRDGAAQDPAGETVADLLHRNREAGGVAVDGAWSLSPRVSLDYGATLAHYGYLEDAQLLSPRLAVAVEAAEGTRLRAAVIRNLSAPGGQEFRRPVSGAWLPPERTFSPLSAAGLLEAERTRHVEVGLERDIGPASVIGVRRYSQSVSNQLVTIFGLLPGAAGRDHYYLAAAGGARSDGWGVRFEHDLPGRVHGVVDYSRTRARWTTPTAAEWALHDITTSVETEIPETATRVVVLARVNSSFARAADPTAGSGLDARFAFRVKQALPFTPFSGSEWEVLVDVRNLFYEPVPGASIHDELLVLNPPRQVVGGLVVHF